MKFLRIGYFFWSLTAFSFGAESTTPDVTRYRLFVRDLVRMAVQGESDMTVDRRIDGLGEIYVPLLGHVKISGMTPAEAQSAIAKRYMEEDIFIKPEVVITVVEYSPKEIMVLGQVGRQGKQSLPAEASSISIVEAITSAGGFTRIGKGDAVRVTRRDEKGVEQSVTLNVEKMIEGRGNSGEAFLLQPGDVVFVPERVF
jgi:protein involved in polysaccharide export with SLBB domain